MWSENELGGDGMRRDCSISWGYIVRKMEEVFGVKPDSDIKYSYAEIETRMNYIWSEFIDVDDEVTE